MSKQQNRQFSPAPLVLCVLSALCVASTASAESSSKLPTITVSAPAGSSEYGQLRGDVFNQVLKDKTGHSLLARNQANNIRNLLRYEAGVGVGGDNGRYGNQGFNIRGISGNRIGMKVDGEEVPSSYQWNHDPNTFGRDLVDPDSLREVDVTKDPSALVNNPANLGGSVNLRTYEPSDFVSGSRHHYIGLKSSYTSADSGVGLTGIVAAKKDTMAGFVLYTRRQGHEIKNFGDIGGVGVKQGFVVKHVRTEPNPQDSTTQNVLAKLHLGGDSQYFDLTLGDYWKRTNTDMYSDNYATYNPTNIDKARDKFEFQRFSIAYHDNTLPGPLPFFYVKFYRNNFNAKNDTFSVGNAGKHQYLNQNTTGAEASFSGHYRGSLISNDITLFASFTHHESSFISEGIKWNPDVASKKGVASIKDKIKIANQFTIEPSLTYTIQETNSRPDALYQKGVAKIQANGQKAWEPLYHNSSITPAIRLSYDINPNWQVYAAYARGQRNPDFESTTNLAHPAGPGVTMSFLANPHLKAETSNNFELGTTVAMDKWAAKFSVFNNEYRNFINKWGRAVSPYPNMILLTENIDKVHTYGAELNAVYIPITNVQLRAGIAWMKGTQENDGKRTDFVGTLPLKAILGAGYHSNKWGVDLDWTLVKGLNETVAGSAYAPGKHVFNTAGYGLLDLTGYWQPVKNVTFRGGVYNLTDKKYISASDAIFYQRVNLKMSDANTQPKRNYSVSVDVNF